MIYNVLMHILLTQEHNKIDKDNESKHLYNDYSDEDTNIPIKYKRLSKYNKNERTKLKENRNSMKLDEKDETWTERQCRKNHETLKNAEKSKRQNT